MPTYVVFDKDNGEVIETHFVPEDMDVSRDWLLDAVGDAYDRDALDVTQLGEQMPEPGKAYRIDPKTRQIARARKKSGGGSGVAAIRSGDSVNTPDPAQAGFRKVDRG